MSGITVELFRKYGLGALFTVVVLFVITWIVTHVMAGPGGTVSVWGLVEYTKDAGVEKELRHELEERKNHIQKLEAALQAKEVQLSNAASCIQNKKELEEELDKVRTEKNSCEVITTQMQEKDSVKIQLFKRIATLQKELNMKSVLRKENVKKIKKLNKELAIHEAKCIPVERVVTVEVGICAVYECKTEAKIIKEQDKESCAAALEAEKEIKTFQADNTLLEKEIEKIYEQLIGLQDRIKS